MKAYCDVCNKMVQIKTETVPVEVKLNGNIISVMGRESACQICGETISGVIENSIYNLELAQEVVEKYKRQMDEGYV